MCLRKTIALVLVFVLVMTVVPVWAEVPADENRIVKTITIGNETLYIYESTACRISLICSSEGGNVPVHFLFLDEIETMYKFYLPEEAIPDSLETEEEGWETLVKYCLRNLSSAEIKDFSSISSEVSIQPQAGSPSAPGMLIQDLRAMHGDEYFGEELVSMNYQGVNFTLFEDKDLVAVKIFTFDWDPNETTLGEILTFIAEVLWEGFVATQIPTGLGLALNLGEEIALDVLLPYGGALELYDCAVFMPRYVKDSDGEVYTITEKRFMYHAYNNPLVVDRPVIDVDSLQTVYTDSYTYYYSPTSQFAASYEMYLERN